MHLSESEGVEDKIFVVTGGHGFVGSALCLDLLRRGARLVRVLDIRDSSPRSEKLKNHGVVFIKGDITRKEDVRKAFSGADCVFHLASFGMSGKEMLRVGRVDEVNINGTCHVLDACLEFGIRRLVYVSTYNVVFGGKEIVNGNESLRYFPIDQHVDHYSRSKSLAEQLVLKTNGRCTNDEGKHMYTCAVRPAAIYGPGEERHLPRIISLAKLGILPFRIGGPNVKTDWIYVDNLVHALIMASMGLLDDIPGREGVPIAAGQSYFISDESPVNTFEFLTPLLRSLGYDMPKRSLSLPKALLVGRITSAFYTLLYPWLDRHWLPQPAILPAEAYKVGVTHYFSFLKAKEELGYVPMVSPKEGMALTISYWQGEKNKSLDGPVLLTWVLVIFGMVALFAAAFLPDIGPVPVIRVLGLFFFRSIWALRAVFVGATAVHVGEGVYAWHLAKRVDPRNSFGWFVQTSVLGVFSLRYLVKRSKTRK